MQKLIFPFLLAIFVISIFLPFFTEAPISWVTGFCYIIYDSILLCFVAHKVRGHLRAAKVKPKVALSLKVCLLIAAKNEKSIFSKCLSHIASQTRHPDQIIIVDDGSTDGSFEVLNKHFILKWNGKLWQSQNRPEYFVLKKENSGKARSLNQALPFVTAKASHSILK